MTEPHSIAGWSPASRQPPSGFSAPVRLTQPLSLVRWLSLVAWVVWLALSLATVPAEATDADPASTGPIDYPQDIQPLLNRRCVVCHGCYDAPCQLKLDAWEGVARGAHKDKVYDGTRLLAAPLTRLEDADGIAAWRDKGFYPVLPQGPSQDLQRSLMARMLRLKQQHPLPPTGRLADSFDLAINRDQQCPRSDEFAGYASEHPLWGMPYALPGLAESEQQTLLRWLQQGAPGQPPAVQLDRYATEIANWEAFLNQASNKARLMSRYIFEHLFLASLHFDQRDDGTGEVQFFRLVRSRTPPGQPASPIASRRPYDDPGVDRVYYRLLPVQSSRLAKTHMPYALNPARQQRWRTLFLSAEYSVEQLPGYDAQIASNPFISFQALPVKSRYRFMLDEAGFTIMGFIKGPVCRGQVALNVINDHFWVFFVDPELLDVEGEARFLAQQRHNLRLPAEDESSASLLSWVKYAEAEADYLAAKRQALSQLAKRAPPSLEYVWNGGNQNPNASLTVFRHFDSASVVTGLVGDTPQTAWLIGYPTLERIHYLLVAGFDVYGNVGHQLSSRLYMDFLRMESEFNFLTLLPRQARQQVRDHWYRDAGQHVDDYLAHIKEYLFGSNRFFNADSAIRYRSNQPLPELYALLRQHFANLPSSGYSLDDSSAPADVTAALAPIQSLRGAQLALLPEVSFIRVDGSDQQSWYFTLLHNSAHSNISELFDEQQRRLPEEDTLLLVSGLLGAYPNQFYRVAADQLDSFVSTLAAVDSEQRYGDLLSRFGIRRNAPRFWTFSDRLQDVYRALRPLQSGLFDYNRLDNR